MSSSSCRADDPTTCRVHGIKPGFTSIDAVFNYTVANKPDFFTTTAQIITYHKKRHPKLSLTLDENKNGFIVLSQIIIPKEDRRLGLGTEILQDIIDTADYMNWSLALTPDSVFGTPKPKLEAFYRKFGFVKNLGRNRDFAIEEEMIRYPQ